MEHVGFDNRKVIFRLEPALYKLFSLFRYLEPLRDALIPLSRRHQIAAPGNEKTHKRLFLAGVQMIESVGQ